jgi:ABC-type sugar transport system permease subunit
LRHESEESELFIFACALVLAVTLVIVPTDSTYNQVLLLPGIFMLLHHEPSLWKQNFLTRLAWSFAAAALFWPWIAALGLTIASFILPASRVQQAWALPFYTSLAIPLAVLGLLFQYAFQILPSKHDAAGASEQR